MDTTAFLDSLKEEIVERNALIHHPLMKLLYEGKLTREQLVGWAKQFWVIPHTHMISNAGKLAHAQLWRGGFLQQLLESPYDKEITDKLGHAVMDEMGKTDLSARQGRSSMSAAVLQRKNLAARPEEDNILAQQTNAQRFSS